MSKEKKKSIILVDNDPRFANIFRVKLEDYKLDGEFDYCPVIPSDPETDVLDECKKQILAILSRTNDIATVMIDIVLREGSKNINRTDLGVDTSGIDLAHWVRKILPGVPIIAITYQIKNEPGLVPEITFENCFEGLWPKELIEKFFSKPIFKSYLKKAREKVTHSISGKEVDSNTHNLTKQLEGVPTILDFRKSRLNISDDPVTEYFVKEIGLETFNHILWDGFNEAEGNVQQFNSGFSGAKLFEVSGRVNQQVKSQGNATHWILKLSRDKEKIEKEFNNHQYLKSRGVSADLYPTLLNNKVITVNSWYGMITEKEKESETLYSLLRDHRLKTVDINSLNKELRRFANGLYGDSIKETTFIWQKFYKIGRKQKVSILRFLHETHSTLIKQAGKDLAAQIQKIQNFVLDANTIENISKLKQDVDKRLIHGDLHTRNILFNFQTKKIITIDFPNVAEDHAVKDFAKLETDFIFSAFLSKDGNDTNWKNLNRCEPFLDTINKNEDFFAENLHSHNSSKNELKIINSFRNCAKSVLPGISRDEYLLALLSYTLKLLQYPDIKLPKKAFAIRYIDTIFNQFS